MSELGIFYPNTPAYKNTLTFNGDTYDPFGSATEEFDGATLHDLIKNNPNAIVEMSITGEGNTIKLYGSFILDETGSPGADSVLGFVGIGMGDSMDSSMMFVGLYLFNYTLLPSHFGYLTAYINDDGNIITSTVDDEAAIPVVTKIYY